jgi:hypothetical protein
VGIRHETEMTDTNESFWQNVHQKSPNELFGGHRHQPLFVAPRVIPPAECDVIAIECNQSVIGDRDAVRITSEIAYNLLGSAEGWLRMDNPMLPEQGSQECRKLLWFAEMLDRPGKLQTFLPKSPTQSCDEFSAEHFSEDFHR